MLRWSLAILCLSLFSVTVVSIPVHRVTRGSVRAQASGAAWPPRNPAKFAVRRANPGAPLTARQREIVKKVQSPALPSAKYREKAERSPYHVTRGPNNQWSVARQPKGAKRHGRANEAGDHVFELQMLHKGLQQNGKTFKSLDRTHRREIRRIMNHPSNMQFVDAGVNSGKGQWIKGAMKGQPVKPRPGRDGYIRATMPIAHNTANKLDAYLTKHNLANAGTMSNLLHKTYRNGGALGRTEAIGALPTRPPGASHSPSPPSSEPTTSGSEASSSGRNSPARSNSWATDSNASTPPGSRAPSPPPSQTPSASSSQHPVPGPAAANTPVTANAPPTTTLPRRNTRRTTRND